MWLSKFGLTGLKVVCKTASEINAEGGQEIGRINFGGAIFNQYANPANTDLVQGISPKGFEEIFFARLAIDLRMKSPMSEYYISIVGAAKNFETAIEDLKEKIERRVFASQSTAPVIYAPEGGMLAPNAECSTEYLKALGYRSIKICRL